MDDTEGSSNKHNSEGVYALYRWNLVHPVCPVTMEWDLGVLVTTYSRYQENLHIESITP